MQTACPIKYDRFLNRSILDINGYCQTQYDVLVSCRLGIVKCTLCFYVQYIYSLDMWVEIIIVYIYTLQASLKTDKRTIKLIS